MKYSYTELINAHSEEGIVFISLKHMKTEIIATSFLGPHVLSKPIYLNWDKIVEDLKKIEEEHKKKGVPIILNTILLEIQQDLIKIYKDFI